MPALLTDRNIDLARNVAARSRRRIRTLACVHVYPSQTDAGTPPEPPGSATTTSILPTAGSFLDPPHSRRATPTPGIIAARGLKERWQDLQHAHSLSADSANRLLPLIASLEAPAGYSSGSGTTAGSVWFGVFVLVIIVVVAWVSRRHRVAHECALLSGIDST
jgi:hypothetical protein